MKGKTKMSRRGGWEKYLMYQDMMSVASSYRPEEDRKEKEKTRKGDKVTRW